MKIILDAMGGDNAPDAVVRGALEAAKEFGVQIVLVGRGADILASMKAQGWDTLPDGVELANAEDVVDMHCDPAAVVKQHPNSSLVLGARMLAQGGGDAFISAGNTGALLCKKGLNGIRKTMDYRETGGSIVIGISRPVIKAHGSSDDAAIRGAIRQAIRAVESGFCEEIRAKIGQMILPREDEHAE